MSLPLKLLIAFVVWLLYFLLTFNGCKEELCYACNDTVTEEVTTTSDSALAAAPVYPIYFNWNDSEAYTNENFDSLKQLVMRGMGEGKILEITGKYFESESAPDGFDNMGFARASQVAQLFRGEIPEDQIAIKARLVDEPDGAREQPFDAALFDWEDTAEEAVAETVEELDDRIRIRFPFGSTQGEYNEAVNTYLDKLAERVRQTGEPILLTGHTDNVDSDEFNQNLGMQRANGIKQELLNRGVPADQITTESKGESQPVASNDTEEGRYENRRVEVRLIKN
jgi:outer membrane protein OmpA-like peptidoglycan-associated protein